jgi:hypothetical protein
MLVITAQQLAKLDAIRLAEFHRVCVRAMRTRHAEDAEHLDDSALATLVRKVDGRATEEFGVDDEGFRFKIMLLALEHPGLAAGAVVPEIIDIMTWPDRPNERKLSMLEAFLGSQSPEATASMKE